MRNIALVRRGVRHDSKISPVLSLPVTSQALLEACDDGAEIPYTLFLSAPRHRVPQIVIDRGLPRDGWIPVDPRTQYTSHEEVYAVDDCAPTGTLKAGVCAAEVARAVASAILAKIPSEGKVVGQVSLRVAGYARGQDCFRREPPQALVRDKELRERWVESMRKERPMDHRDLGSNASYARSRGGASLFAAAVIVCCACVAAPAIAQDVATAASATITATERASQEWSEYHGAVASRNSVHLIGLVPGRIKAVHAGAGQKVRKGQMLVELEAKDFEVRLEAAESRLANVRAVVEEARGEQARAQKLAAKGYVSEQALEKARARLLSAQASEAEARSGVNEARTQLGYTVLRSPIDGVVTDKYVNPGDFTMPGLPAEVGFPSGRNLMTIYDPGALWFEARIPERYATHVTVGAPVRVSIASAKFVLDARFVEVLPVVDEVSRTFTARVSLPPQPALKLGMSGRARFASGERKVVELPDSAIVERGQLDAVFVDVEGKARLRLVRPGKRQDGRIEILSGVKAGEKIVLHPRANLRDGDAF